jgi:hypothetical protein
VSIYKIDGQLADGTDNPMKGEKEFLNFELGSKTIRLLL